MCKQNKSIQKCVRMTQDTYDFIMSFDGDGFNAKFDSACYMFRQQRDDLVRDLEYYKDCISRHKVHLCDLSKLSNNLDKLSKYIELCDAIVSADMPTLDI